MWPFSNVISKEATDVFNKLQDFILENIDTSINSLDGDTIWINTKDGKNLGIAITNNTYFKKSIFPDGTNVIVVADKVCGVSEKSNISQYEYAIELHEALYFKSKMKYLRSKVAKYGIYGTEFKKKKELESRNKTLEINREAYAAIMEI